MQPNFALIHMGKRGHPYFQISQARMQSISRFCAYFRSFFLCRLLYFEACCSHQFVLSWIWLWLWRNVFLFSYFSKSVLFFFSYIPTVCKSWKWLHEPVRDSQRAGGARLHALQAKPAGELCFFSILFTLYLWTCMEMVHCGMQISMSNILRKLA